VITGECHSIRDPIQVAYDQLAKRVEVMLV